MNTPRPITRVLGAMALVAVSVPGMAENYPFRVAFENVPGAAELEAGDVEAGIEILENLVDDHRVNTGHVLATLCGAYIMDVSLEKAERVCDRAVAEHPGETAYNNRGVLRAFNGDFRGAQADLDRARPERMAEYIEYLRTKDVRLIADGNFGLLEKLAARHSSDEVQTSVAVNVGARVESIEK